MKSPETDWKDCPPGKGAGMEIIIATKNMGKLREFDRMLRPLGFEVAAQSAYCPALEVEETGTTFAENARLKAQAIHARTGKATVADDSGLCVEALGGAPGVYSARYAGEQHSDDDNNRKLLKELEGVPQEERGAYFASAVCCILPDGRMIETEGRCFGRIGFEKKGNEGFGYDPLFLVGEKSFGELSPEEKDAISHRGRALRELCRRLKEGEE